MPTPVKPYQLRLYTRLPGETKPASPQQPLFFRGGRFRVSTIQVTEDLFDKLGIGKKFFRSGASIYLFDKQNYQEFSRLCGVEGVGGFYPLSINGDQDAVFSGQADHLSAISRTIVLPEGYDNVTLTHELLHDVYFGGGLHVSDRRRFIGEVLHWYRLSKDPNYPHHQKNNQFYTDVARLCMEKYKLEDIPISYNLGRYTEEKEFQIFASECFAYAGEALLLPQDAKFKNIPQEIRDHLRFLRLDARRA